MYIYLHLTFHFSQKKKTALYIIHNGQWLQESVRLTFVFLKNLNGAANWCTKVGGWSRCQTSRSIMKHGIKIFNLCAHENYKGEKWLYTDNQQFCCAVLFTIFLFTLLYKFQQFTTKYINTFNNFLHNLFIL